MSGMRDHWVLYGLYRASTTRATDNERVRAVRQQYQIEDRNDFLRIANQLFVQLLVELVEILAVKIDVEHVAFDGFSQHSGVQRLVYMMNMGLLWAYVRVCARALASMGGWEMNK